jgi:hypothetical protein
LLSAISPVDQALGLFQGRRWRQNDFVPVDSFLETEHPVISPGGSLPGILFRSHKSPWKPGNQNQRNAFFLPKFAKIGYHHENQPSATLGRFQRVPQESSETNKEQSTAKIGPLNLTVPSDGEVPVVTRDQSSKFVNVSIAYPTLAEVPETNSPYAENLWLFNRATTNAVLLQIRGANHSSPCDVGWTVQIPWGLGLARATDSCDLWFFNTYLKGETPPFPANPEIYTVQRN